MLTFSRATGQLWKLRVWMGLTALMTIITVAFFSLWMGNPFNLPELVVSAFFFVTSFICFGWWAAAITCPRCGHRPVWHHMRHGSFDTFKERFLGVSTCPTCGFDPRGISATPSRMTEKSRYL
jgi:hypothetical protein